MKKYSESQMRKKHSSVRTATALAILLAAWNAAAGETAAPGKTPAVPFTVQENQFFLSLKGSATDIVDDPEADNGKAAVISGKQPGWRLSYQIPEAFPKEKLDVYVRIRIESEEPEDTYSIVA